MKGLGDSRGQKARASTTAARAPARGRSRRHGGLPENVKGKACAASKDGSGGDKSDETAAGMRQGACPGSRPRKDQAAALKLRAEDNVEGDRTTTRPSADQTAARGTTRPNHSPTRPPHAGRPDRTTTDQTTTRRETRPNHDPHNEPHHNRATRQPQSNAEDNPTEPQPD